MVWTIATSGGTTTITPDGTSSADLKTLLDTAISGSQSGITNPGSGVVYQVTNNIQINGTAPPYFLYIGGIVLDCYQRFVLGNNARVNYSYLNTSGQSVGRTTLILRAQPTGYVIANGIYSISGSTYQQSDSLDLIATNDQSNPGAITYGYDVGSASNGSFDNCTFAAAKTGNRNHIFYFDTSIYANCQWDGWDACEVTSTTLLRSAIFRNVDVLKTYTTDAYLEKVSAASFRVLNSKSAYLTDCSISVYSAVEAFAPSGLYIYERNSFELLGTSTEASGLMVLRLPNNSLIFKRTLDSSGKASGNNPISATNGTSSSSDRLVIPITQITPPSTYLIDNRGAWEGVFVRYGRLPYDIAINLQGNTATSQSIPFSSAIDASITIGNAATVAAYTGIAIDHLNSLISITAAVTKQKLYDYLALEKASFADSGVTAGGNAVPKCCLPTLADFLLPLVA